eukprot:Gb_41639 [translate_table: standard]
MGEMVGGNMTVMAALPLQSSPSVTMDGETTIWTMRKMRRRTTKMGKLLREIKGKQLRKERVAADKYRANSMQQVLEDFFQQQQRFEEQWREVVEGREQERRLREQEWRETMEKLEEERLMKEQAWHEREEQIRA